MKGKLILLLFILTVWTTQSQAQNYKWAIGGGSVSTFITTTDWEQVTYMCTDANRNLYITATMGDDDIRADTFYMAHSFNRPGTGNAPHIFIASYNPDGKMRWAKLLEAQYFSRGYGIQYDGKGNIYTIGYLFGNNKHLGYDTTITSDNLTCFIAKYDTSGKFKWVRFIGADTKATRDAAAFQSAIAIDGKGFIHYYSLIMNGVQITPTLTSTTGTYDLKYDSLGDLISVIKMPMDTLGEIRKILFNPTTQASYAIVNVQYPAGAGDHYWYIAKYNQNDSMVWSDTTNPGTAINDLVYDNSSTLYLAGIENPFIYDKDTFRGSGSQLSLILQLDTLGNLKHGFSFNGFKGADNLIGNITLLRNNSIAATGLLFGTLKYQTDSISSPSNEGWNSVFLVMDSSGRIKKFDQLHGDGYDFGLAITSDSYDNIYVGGFVGDSIYATSIRAYYSNGGETDFFVVKYGYNDGCTLSTEPTPMYSVSGDSTHVPAMMSFTYSGSNTPDSVRWEFGDGSISKTLNPSHTYTDTGLIKVCLTVYGCDSGKYCNWITTLKPTAVNNVKLFPSLEVYPNPVMDELNVNNISAGTTVQLYDVVGGIIYSTIANKDKLTIDTRNIQAGTYMLSLTNKAGQRESLRIVKAE